MRNAAFDLMLVSALSLGVAPLCTRAATYKEVNGVVVVEAEHFDSRQPAQDDDHQWVLAPDELSPDDLSQPWGQYLNARGAKYLVVLPDAPGAGLNRNTPDLQALSPTADYKVEITTTGEYTLYIRDTAYDGSSDSMYVRIIELEKANGGPGPDWYRYNPTPTDSDFDSDRHAVGDTGWDNMLTPEINDASGNEVPATWTISKAGTYTIRIQQREDGNGIDALCLQLSSMPIPAADIPESQAVGATPQPLTITGRVPLPNARAASLTTAIKAVFQDGTTTLDQNSVVLKVDDQTVTFAKDFTNGTTTISYQPSQVFLARSVHTVNVAYKDNTGAALSDSWSFTVQDYLTIPATAAVQPDTTKPGFLVRTWQVDAATASGVAKAEAELAGQLGPNIADLTLFTDTEFGNKYYDETNVINYWDSGVAEGNFPNDATPNVPGIVSPGDNYSVEMVTFIDLPQGVVRMGVNSDDGFRTSFMQAPDPRDKFLVTLGQFDAGRGAGDTTFLFVVETAGVYPFRTVWEEGGGDSACEWFTVLPDRTKLLINDSTNSAARKAYRATTTPASPMATTIIPAPGATRVPPYTLIEVDLKDGVTQVDPASVSLKFDNQTQSKPPLTADKTGDTTVVRLPSPGLLLSNSVHTVELTYSYGAPAQTATRTWSFTVAPYANITLPLDLASPVGSGDASKPGFRLKVFQVDEVEANNSITNAEAELAGQLKDANGQPLPNVADLSRFTDNGYFDEPTVLNYEVDADIGTSSGNFTAANGHPDAEFPGIPGSPVINLPKENFAVEALTYVEFPAAGWYGMVVGSDDNFRVTVAERAGPAALQLGIFDAAGGRGYDITPFFFNVPQAGVWPMRLVYEQGQGGANLEWFLVDSAGKFALLNDTSNPVGLKAFRARAAVTPPPQITAATISGGSISINWTGGGAVEFSSALGPGATWTSTGNSSGSFSETVAPTGNKFYRIKR